MTKSPKVTKIVRIIARLNIGGPAIHAILLSSELNKEGFEDILVCGNASESEGDMHYLANDKGLKPVIIPELERDISFKNDMKALLRIVDIIKKEKPDIIHTHTAKAGALGRVAALFAGTPIRIHTFHGHIFDGYFNPAKAKIFLLIERFLALFTDRIITVSETVKEEIVNKLKVTNDKKCVIVPLGLELENFLANKRSEGSFRKELGVSGDTALVGIVGRLVPVKNIAMFLAAAKCLINKRPGVNAKFIVIGDGESRESLEAGAREMGLEKTVIFTGWKRDLSTVYPDLDVVCLTSLNEGTPVSVIEAMASARPVVATDAGGVKDLVIDGVNGFLVKGNDIEYFSDRVSDLLDDKEKRLRFGMRGRELVETKYLKKRLVSDIKNLYEECIRTTIRRRG